MESRFKMVANLHATTLLKRTKEVFYCEFCEVSQNSVLKNHLSASFWNSHLIWEKHELQRKTWIAAKNINCSEKQELQRKTNCSKKHELQRKTWGRITTNDMQQRNKKFYYIYIFRNTICKDYRKCIQSYLQKHYFIYYDQCSNHFLCMLQKLVLNGVTLSWYFYC